jgi:hypothetical protein
MWSNGNISIFYVTLTNIKNNKKYLNGIQYLINSIKLHTNIIIQMANMVDLSVLKKWGWNEVNSNDRNVKSITNLFYWHDKFIEEKFKLITFNDKREHVNKLNLKEFSESFKYLRKKAMIHKYGGIMTRIQGPDHWTKWQKMDYFFNTSEYVIFEVEYNANKWYMFIQNLEWT